MKYKRSLIVINKTTINKLVEVSAFLKEKCIFY